MSIQDTDKYFDKENLPLSIDWSNGTQEGAGAVVLNGRFVQYAIPDSLRNLYILTTDVSAYHQSHDINSLNKWHAVSIAAAYPSGMARVFMVKNALSMVALGPYNYVFWINDANEYWALRCSPDMKEKAITKLNFDDVQYQGTSINYYSNIAAFVLPPLLAEEGGKIGGLILGKANTDNNGTYYQLVLDPVDFGINSIWKAYRKAEWPRIRYASGYLQTPSNYPQLSCGVFNQGTYQIEGNNESKPYIYLVFASTSIPDKANLTSLVEMTELFSPCNNGDNKVSSLNWVGGLNFAEGRGISFCCDPSGVLFAYYRDAGNKLRSAYLESKWNEVLGPPCLAWDFITNAQDPDGTEPSISCGNFVPAAFFVPLKITTGKSPCSVKKPTDGTGPIEYAIYEGTLNQRYIQCMLGMDSYKKPTLSTFYWGTLFTIPDYVVADVSPEYQKTLVLSMVCDTFPYPIPAEHVWPSGSPSGMVNWGVCTYEYLVGKDSGEEVTSEIVSSSGYKNESQFLVLGLGLSSESSYMTGFSRLSSKVNTRSHVTGTSVETKFLANEESMIISPNGALFGSPPPSKIATAVSLVRRRSESSVADILSLSVRPFVDLISPVPPISVEFPSYCYTPGKLPTYAPDQINAKMKALFDALTATEQEDFIVFGEDFRSFYCSGEYIEKIVERFGVPCFGPERNLPFLDFSFSEHGIERNELQSTSGFVHAGGSFINTTSYIGFGWNIEITYSFSGGKFNGVSIPLVTSAGYALSGTEYNSTMTTTNTETNSWGMRLGEYLNPLDVEEAYSVRMYLLKPSPLWARELKHFGPLSGGSATVDYTYSSPVRILFTVPFVSDKLKARLSR